MLHSPMAIGRPLPVIASDGHPWLEVAKARESDLLSNDVECAQQCANAPSALDLHGGAPPNLAGVDIDAPDGCLVE